MKTTHDSIFYHIDEVRSQPGVAAKLKALTNELSFYDTLWMQGLVQLFLLWGIKWCIRSRKWPLLQQLVMVDMVLSCLLNVPFTGAGKAPVAAIQQLINQSPSGIPVPSLVPINQYAVPDSNIKKMIGDWSMYSKQPGVQAEVAYPIELKNTTAYFSRQEENNHPFIYTAGNDSARLSILSYTPQAIRVSVQGAAGGTLVLQQNHYPHWTYQEAGVPKEVEKYGDCFMKAPVNSSNAIINFTFNPVLIKWAMLCSLLMLLLLAGFLLFSRKRVNENNSTVL